MSTINKIAKEISDNIIPNGIIHMNSSFIDRVINSEYGVDAETILESIINSQPTQECLKFKNIEDYSKDINGPFFEMLSSDLDLAKLYYCTSENALNKTEFAEINIFNLSRYSYTKYQQLRDIYIKINAAVEEYIKVYQNRLMNSTKFYSFYEINKETLFTSITFQSLLLRYKYEKYVSSWHQFHKNNNQTSSNDVIRTIYLRLICSFFDFEYSNKKGTYFDFERFTKYESVIQTFIHNTEKANEEFLKYNFEIEEKNKKSLETHVQLIKKAKNERITIKKRLNDIRHIKLDYDSNNKECIAEYFCLILISSLYEFDFDKNIEVDYNYKNELLFIEYSLPTIEQIPNIKEFRHQKNNDKIVYLSDTDMRKLYDDIIYKIVLRSITELLGYDTLNYIETINFNGWVNSLNKATGRIDRFCILSVQVNKNNYIDINIQNVDPKMCFRYLKGVSCSKLNTMTAIQPINQINKTDKRFVDSQNIEFDNSTNLAAMDWEDFEHLIRELFEKEFSSNGGEVKVTQASRDGGVDAIAFDPDPIRGGKIVIQAKRYTNTVGVSAVRDLYGTVLNEGANKGILVTTSDYGADSYEFANGKPLTLLNGGHILYLLEKHGQKARIDIEEAKKEAKQL